jgi:hypothetical protein
VLKPSIQQLQRQSVGAMSAERSTLYTTLIYSRRISLDFNCHFALLFFSLADDDADDCDPTASDSDKEPGELHGWHVN